MKPEHGIGSRELDASGSGFWRWIPGLVIARRYQLGWLLQDALAGVTLSAFLVPAGMVYAGGVGTLRVVRGVARLHGVRPEPYPRAWPGLGTGCIDLRSAEKSGRQHSVELRNGGTDEPNPQSRVHEGIS